MGKRTEKVSLLQTVEPDYEIKVGIKDDHVFSVDWLAMMQKGKQVKGYRSKLIKYLEQAISILKSAGFGR